MRRGCRYFPAPWNVGASASEEYGAYFAWGETQPAWGNYYSWSDYILCNSSGTTITLTKYNTDNSYGTVDNKTVLDPEDDAAHVNWGGTWRMPTQSEVQELIDNCTMVWTTENGVNGRRFISKKTGYKDKSIFIPAAGSRGESSLYSAGSNGYYWSSSLYTAPPRPMRATCTSVRAMSTLAAPFVATGSLSVPSQNNPSDR